MIYELGKKETETVAGGSDFEGEPVSTVASGPLAGASYVGDLSYGIGSLFTNTLAPCLGKRQKL